MFATSATAASPLCGSTEPSPVKASGYSSMAAATVSLGTRPARGRLGVPGQQDRLDPQVR